MKSIVPEDLPAISPTAETFPPRDSKVAIRFGFALLLVLIAFARPLWDWFLFTRQSPLFSYILLVPFVSVYAGWLAARRKVSGPEGFGSLRWSVLPAALALLALGAVWFVPVPPNDRLVLVLLAFVFAVATAGMAALGAERMRRFAFPFAFLLFMVPLPLAVVNAIEVFFQHGSADVASVMINLSGLPAVRDGLFFRLPGLLIEVAQECSGIRSTIVLFITSLLAGHLFLRSNWRRAALALFVIPLAMLRNGFRIFTLAYLTVEVDPRVIDSPLHHRGGPIFFALSLIPFFLLLWLLRKAERPQRQ